MVHLPQISVLVVDDNTIVRRMLCQFFRLERDFDVCGEATNGREAIDKAQELQPDMIVMDLSMPVMNGLDASRVLKRRMPNVPIIMFSDYSEACPAGEARAAGIAASIPKSDGAAKLLRTARGLFGRNVVA